MFGFVLTLKFLFPPCFYFIIRKNKKRLALLPAIERHLPRRTPAPSPALSDEIIEWHIKEIVVVKLLELSVERHCIVSDVDARGNPFDKLIAEQFLRGVDLAQEVIYPTAVCSVRVFPDRFEEFVRSGVHNLPIR